MAFTYAAVMRRMSTVLQDDGAVRWTAPEMKDWIDQAVVDIHIAKPNAKVAVQTLTLAAGTNQTIPATASMLVAIRRNGGAGGRAIEILDNLDTLSRQMPDWAATANQAAQVQMVYMDPLTPRDFVVIPPNDGSGTLEAVVGVAPVPGAAPAGAAALVVDNYTANVDLPDAYQTAVLHLALARAFLKDGDSQGGQTQAQGHLAQGLKAVNDLIAGEKVAAGARVTRAQQT